MGKCALHALPGPSAQVSYEELTAFFTEGKTAKKLGEFSEILSIMMSAPPAPSSPQSRPFSGSTFFRAAQRAWAGCRMNENPFAAIDKDGSGTVTWEEFEGWVEEQAEADVDPQEEINRLKKLLDDRSKMMTEVSLASCLARISQKFSRAPIHACIFASALILCHTLLKLLATRTACASLTLRRSRCPPKS